jgi:hypothetical protein
MPNILPELKTTKRISIHTASNVCTFMSQMITERIEHVFQMLLLFLLPLLLLLLLLLLVVVVVLLLVLLCCLVLLGAA